MLFHKRLALFGNSAFFSFSLLPLKIPVATAYNRNFVLDSLVFSCPKFLTKRSVAVNFSVITAFVQTINQKLAWVVYFYWYDSSWNLWSVRIAQLMFYFFNFLIFVSGSLIQRCKISAIFLTNSLFFCAVHTKQFFSNLLYSLLFLS